MSAWVLADGKHEAAREVPRGPLSPGRYLRLISHLLLTVGKDSHVWEILHCNHYSDKPPIWMQRNLKTLKLGHKELSRKML